MELIRKAPPIDIDAAYIEDKNEIIRGVITAIISLAATLLGLAFLWTGMNYKSLGGWFTGLCFTPLFAIQTVMCVRVITSGISNIAKRNRWLRKAIGVQVKIVDRKAEYNDYAETREEMWDCSLAILMPHSIKGAQHGQVAWLKVSSRVYGKNSNRDITRILCDPSDSNVFIFEDE